MSHTHHAINKSVDSSSLVKFIITLSALLITSSFTTAALAYYIGNNLLNPSTNLPDLTGHYGFNNFTIDQISDGIASDNYPYNGFASTHSSGTIIIDLAGIFNLKSFILWNDVNVGAEGIDDFRLDFYNHSDTLIDPGFSTSFTAPLSQTAPQEYIFDTIVQNVSRVDLVIFSSHWRIEIREIGFDGDCVYCNELNFPVRFPEHTIPEPTTLVLVLTGVIHLMNNKKRRHRLIRHSPQKINSLNKHH